MKFGTDRTSFRTNQNLCVGHDLLRSETLKTSSSRLGEESAVITARPFHAANDIRWEIYVRFIELAVQQITFQRDLGTCGPSMEHRPFSLLRTKDTENGFREQRGGLIERNDRL
ncbi:hypothetical protein CDAR_52721 [Caerostris darwini]|uniref:Uncharacterized protein n=1 Tax=Caerostris darwini TaxID=1538125 RepID=A0AAV4SZZ0_9ARAC|nr:hypothetical protein CDAR_52721 [Caerostris darwini]